MNLCGYGTFTDPEDIRPLVLSLTGFNVTQTNVPGDGIDVAEVHRLMSAISVTFFNAVNKALLHQDEVDDDGNVCPGGYCVPDVRFKKYLSPKWILKKEVNILSEVVLTGEDMKALDCRAGEEGCED